MWTSVQYLGCSSKPGGCLILVETAGISRSSRLKARIRSQARRMRREFPALPASRVFASRKLRSKLKSHPKPGGCLILVVGVDPGSTSGRSMPDCESSRSAESCRKVLEPDPLIIKVRRFPNPSDPLLPIKQRQTPPHVTCAQPQPCAPGQESPPTIGGS